MRLVDVFLVIVDISGYTSFIIERMASLLPSPAAITSRKRAPSISP